MILLKEYFKKIATYYKVDIFDVNHSVARFKERVPEETMSSYYKTLKQGIAKIINTYGRDTENYYILVSKSKQYGIQLEYRKDTKTGQMAGFTATSLSKDEMKFYKHNDVEILVENLLSHSSGKLNESKIKENLNLIYHRYQFKERLKGYDVFLEDGKVNKTFEIIEV